MHEVEWQGMAERAAAAGYRRDWRGLVAYAFTPEAWTTPAFTVFVLTVGAVIGALTVDAVTQHDNAIQIAVNAAVAFLLLVRPTLRAATRRARRDDRANAPTHLR